MCRLLGVTGLFGPAVTVTPAATACTETELRPGQAQCCCVPSVRAQPGAVRAYPVQSASG